MMNKPIIFIIYVLLSSFSSGDSSSNGAPYRELNILELEFYVNTEKGRAILEHEFQTIQGGQRKPWAVAEMSENLKKNRYSDLLAYDDTRVVLETLPNDPYSDYINANYIDGINRKKEYVATQGPLPNTINDFWRMIWQLNATKIIMLANIIEHNSTKVEKYWPETGNDYYDITVTKISEHEMPKIQHVVRTFSIKKKGESGSRTLRQFHFTGWPDFGVPTDRLSVLSIIHQARKYNFDSEAPLVVHCSAGVGRTGTIILSDSMIQRAVAEGMVNFPKRLDHMRLQRVDVVEKKEQYVFAHEAVYHFFTGNKTDEYLKMVDDEYKKIDEFHTDVHSGFSHPLQYLKRHNNSMGKLSEALEHAPISKDVTTSSL